MHILNKLFLIIFYILLLNADQKVNVFVWTPSWTKSNFGDELGQKIIEKIIKYPLKFNIKSDHKLLSVGSILHFAKNNDTIWGTGLNGKIPLGLHKYINLDVRAVRGPITRNFLLSRNIKCPEVYGDPALLMPILFPELKLNQQREYIIIPNLNEIAEFKNYPNLVLPINDDCLNIVNEILKSKFVISSSLHGIIVAEAFGIPARLIRITEKESLIKFQDYYYSTGRKDFKIALSLEEALKMGGERMPAIDLKLLLDSFPYDKF